MILRKDSIRMVDNGKEKTMSSREYVLYLSLSLFFFFGDLIYNMLTSFYNYKLLTIGTYIFIGDCSSPCKIPAVRSFCGMERTYSFYLKVVLLNLIKFETTQFKDIIPNIVLFSRIHSLDSYGERNADYKLSVLLF